ncbi:MAG: glycosyltransferase family 2 protein [Gelidibacter sp.]
MKISVIIPTRNRFDYINLLIEDLRQQTVSDFEVIVVDQSDIQRLISNCIYVFTESKGPCISRNIGVAKAKGDILVFLDDDARINSDFIEEITAPIICGRFDAVAGAVCDPQGNYLLEKDQYLTRNNLNFIKVLTNNPNSSESRITLSFPGGCSAILTKAFKKIGGFDETFDPTGAGEDREMAIKLYKYGFSTWYNSKAKLLHERAPFGGSRETGSRMLMLDVHTYNMCKKHFSEELANVLRKNIIDAYRKRFISSVLKLQLARSKYLLLKEVKQRMK